MPDDITCLALVLAFGFVLIAGSWLDAGSPTILAGLFPPLAIRDWPIGVQEPDAPRFAVAHLDALRPGMTSAPDRPIQPAEIVELFERPLSTSPADLKGEPASSPPA